MLDFIMSKKSTMSDQVQPVMQMFTKELMDALLKSDNWVLSPKNDSIRNYNHWVRKGGKLFHVLVVESNETVHHSYKEISDMRAFMATCGVRHIGGFICYKFYCQEFKSLPKWNNPTEIVLRSEKPLKGIKMTEKADRVFDGCCFHNSTHDAHYETKLLKLDPSWTEVVKGNTEDEDEEKSN